MHLIDKMSFEKDLECVAKVRDGDLVAFTYLVEKYKEMVYAVALKVLGNAADAEDVAQESFIKAYQRIGDFKKASKFSTWLYTIAYRSALYHKRGNAIDTRRIELSDEERFQTITNSQSDDFKTREQQKFIKIAIDSLPPMEGLLITFFYIDENTIQEISAITSLSTTNIKVKLFRARKKLRKKLEIILRDESNSIL